MVELENVVEGVDQVTTYVLVPGGWCGGWAWKDVARLLRQAGHEVYTPTLTGLGEREHLAHPDIDLDTHILDIANVLRYEGLWNVILVGWSYGGMVITGLAERMSERLNHLVYLDAYVPRDGEALADLRGDAEAYRTTLEDMLSKGTWGLPHDPPDALNRVAHPIKTLLQPLARRDQRAAEIPRTFICCTEKDMTSPGLRAVTLSARRAREAGWRYRELPTGHTCVWTMPTETAQLLLEVASKVAEEPPQ